MYDLSTVNDAPGTCSKCRGSGVYRWGAVGTRDEKSGTCFSCRGTGKQSAKQIRRNRTYNRYKVAQIVRGDHDPGYVDLDRAYEDQCAEICGR